MFGKRMSRCAALVGSLLLAIGAAQADQQGAQIRRALDVKPTAVKHDALPSERVPVVEMPKLDSATLAVEDLERLIEGLAPRFAVPFETFHSPDTDGVWEDLGDGLMLWRLRITSPNAISTNFGFTDYKMPAGGQLYLYTADHTAALRPFTAADNNVHGQLWTPPLPGNDVMIEVTIPAEQREALQLELGAINLGYRGFYAKDDSQPESGWCNIDVICPEGDDWRAEIASVAVISTGGWLFCSGFMVNNTAEDQTPFFMTARHCGVNAGNAASLVVFWNYETSICGGTPDGSLNNFQTGSVHLASHSSSDFTLVQLNSSPNPDWGVSYAGWDRSGADATSAVAIHHPSTDEKAISFEFDPTTTTSYLGNTSPGDGTHVRVADWDLGTTEPGSSGSPLFDQNHRVIGQLHGGYAACGNNLPDWYGKFSVSWVNGLASHLDPIGSGAVTVDTLAPWMTGMMVSPAAIFAAEGPVGGPFTPSSVIYTVKNNSDYSIDYSVSKDANWITVSNATGTIGAGGSAEVSVSINQAANALGKGQYQATLSFINETDNDGDTARLVQLDVGVPVPIYIWNLDTNPGWQTEGLWAWGQPTGQGGQYGYPDPTSGYTGLNVYGYNLNGDYENNLPPRHLTTHAIDCSNLTRVQLKFWRWLGVEQPIYDKASISVSTNGTNWTQIWENPTEITDNQWVHQHFDISDIADNQPTVYIRWTMGPTDGSWQYCGWNIDDIEIWGVEADTAIPGDLNGDGCVDHSDLSILLAAYGSAPGHPNWNPDADINGDGSVGHSDLAVLLQHWGEGC